MMPTAPVWVGHPVFHYWGAILLGLAVVFVVLAVVAFVAFVAFVWERR